MWMSWSLKWLVFQLSVLQLVQPIISKKMSKLFITGPLWEQSTIDLCFFFHKRPVIWKMFPCMIFCVSDFEMMESAYENEQCNWLSENIKNILQIIHMVCNVLHFADFTSSEAVHTLMPGLFMSCLCIWYFWLSKFGHIGERWEK